MTKTIRPMFSTVVEPWEYDIDAQMEAFVKAANKEQAGFMDVDVGKLWGLYQAWKEQKESLIQAVSLIKFYTTSTKMDKESGKVYTYCKACHANNFNPNADNYSIDDIDHFDLCRIGKWLKEVQS